MITIRLSRGGVRNKPLYHIVVAPAKSKIKGPALEILGLWHPATKKININKERLDFWVKRGAKVSQAVNKLI